MAYDLTKVITTPDGMVQTGDGSFVNKDSISDNGYAAALNYKAAKGTATATPPTPAPAPAAAPAQVQRYPRQTYEGADGNLYYNDDNTFAGKAPVKSADLEMQKANDRQARIDAIKALYAPKIDRQKEENDRRLARTNAMIANRGLGGSNAAGAAKEDTIRMNDAASSGVEAEQAKAIMDALSDLDTAYAEKQRVANEDLKYSQAQAEKAQKDQAEKAQKALDTFAGAGKTLIDIKNDPQTYNQVKDILGWSDYQIDNYLHTKSGAKANQYYSPNPDGSTRVTIVTANPDGTLKESHHDITVPYAQFSKEEKITGKNGAIYQYDPATDSFKTIVGGSTGGKPIPGAPPGVTDTQVARVRQQLGSVGTSEGYANPYLYRDAYDEWVQKGGSPTVFLKEFPPEQYINPKHSTLKNDSGELVLPAYLQNNPKKKEEDNLF